MPALKERFPDKPFVFDQPPGPIASLHSPSGTQGGVEICDDGDEATIYLFNATHSHFGCHDETLTEEEKHRQISSDVVEFLEALFADRVVVWRVFGGMAGGWRLLRSAEKTPGPSLLRQQFLWSKEITDQ